MSSVLVVGGCGFIGSHVVDQLLSLNTAVKVLDRGPERFRSPLNDVSYVYGDFTDSAVIAEALSGVATVVHLASTSIPATSNLNPVEDIVSNLAGTVRLLETMRKLSIRRIVYLSSGGAVYGIPRTDPVTEDHPLNPISSYGIVKVAVEKYLEMERYLYGLEYVALRPSNPYGPRQGHVGLQGLIGTFLWRCLWGEPLQIWRDGSVCRDYIHVTDVARICVAASLGGPCGTYNVGSGTGLSVADVAALVCEITGTSSQFELHAGRKFDVPRIVLDTRAARQAFGWGPQIEFRQGLLDTWSWVKTQAELPH